VFSQGTDSLRTTTNLPLNRITQAILVSDTVVSLAKLTLLTYDVALSDATMACFRTEGR
jgi:hypothetical protein